MRGLIKYYSAFRAVGYNANVSNFLNYSNKLSKNIQKKFHFANNSEKTA